MQQEHACSIILLCCKSFKLNENGDRTVSDVAEERTGKPEAQFLWQKIARKVWTTL